MDLLLYITFPFSGLMMIIISIVLGMFLTRKFDLGWRLWGIGAVTFILSQVGHIPFNSGITWLFKNGYLPTPPKTALLYFNAVILGLSSGIWEEPARYFMYRWWAKDARSWQKALLAGGGHGGIEAILLGVLSLFIFVQMVAYRNADLSAIIPPDQLTIAQAKIQAYWSVPWYAALLSPVERIFALCLHTTNSVMVLQVFTRKQSRWLWAAVGWHALFNAAAIIVNSNWGPYFAEGILGIGAVICLVIIFTLRHPDNVDQPEPILTPIELLEIHQIEETMENLNSSRYNP